MRLEAWKLRLMSCVAEFTVEFGLLPSLSAVRVPERGKTLLFLHGHFLSVEEKLTGDNDRRRELWS